MPSEYPVPAVKEPPPIPPAWSPVAIGWLSALLSPIPAGILWSLNWRRLGQPDRTRGGFLFVVGVAVVYLPLAMLLPARANMVFMAANIAIASYFHSSQKELFAQHLARGGPRARLLKPVLYSGLAVLAILGGAAAWILPGALAAGDAIDQGNQLLETGDDRGAREAFLRARKADPDEPAAYWNLALADRRLHRYDEARRTLETLRQLDDGFQGSDGSTIDEQLRLLRTDEEFEQARRALDSGDGAGALATFTRLAGELPGDPALHWNLSLAQGLVGHPDEALRELEKVRELDPHGRVIDAARIEQQRAAITEAHPSP